ncbi:MAG: hypothetical protein WC934_06150 [Acidithiobacillus sp.]|uniref:hypothetical protein n=1 Tax=Acidithiobacillus sp. TaxID=1872118 RepID=UPI00355E8AD2
MEDNIGRFCRLPYPDHPNGCPNFGKNELCPPLFKPIPHTKFNDYSKLMLLWAEFDFKSYKIEMKQQWIENNKSKGIEKEPTDKQISCCLYWQNSVKRIIIKSLNTMIKDKNISEPSLILACGSGFKHKKGANNCASMEAGGINVILTFKKLHIDIEVKPVNKVILCILLGFRNNYNNILRNLDKIMYSKKVD